MSDQRLGSVLRAVRIKRSLRQIDVARRAGVSASLVSLLERGHLGTVSINTLRRVAAVLDVRVDLLTRWRGGELDRLLNSRHAALQEAVTRQLQALGWTVLPEVSFAVGGERGVVDLLAWHPASRTLLVIEIKTEIVDVSEMLGTFDRKRRLAFRLARDRGWQAAEVGGWLVVADSSANRQRVRRHAALLNAALPDGIVPLRKWLRTPAGSLAALTFFANSIGSSAKQQFAARQRVRVPPRSQAERGK